MFDDNGAYLDAWLPCADAIYTINLYDPSTTPATLITTISNSTSTGLIQEDWNLTYAGTTNLFTGETVEAVFNVILLDPGTNTHKRIMKRAAGSLTEWGANFDFVYMYTPTNNALETAYAKDGAIWNGMLGVCDVLLAPRWGYDPYNSYFDRYFDVSWQPYPGYVTSRSTITNTLFPDMTNGLTKQFYCYSHGSGNSIGNAAGTAYIRSSELARLLRNTYKTTGPVEIDAKNPYRLVWLDGCSTASKKDWRRAFGIFPFDAKNQAARNKVGPQAYIGWGSEHGGWLHFEENSEVAINASTAYTKTLAMFFTDWMSRTPLAQCISHASTPQQNIAPLPIPENKNCRVWGTGPYGPFNYNFTNITTSKIYVIGYSGLTVNGRDPAWDRRYAAPATTE